MQSSPEVLGCNLSPYDMQTLAKGAQPFARISDRLRPLLTGLDAAALPRLQAAKPAAAQAWPGRRGNTRVTIRFPSKDLTRLDELVEAGRFISRNHLVRCAIWSPHVDAADETTLANGQRRKTKVQLYPFERAALRWMATTSTSNPSQFLNSLLEEAVKEGPAVAAHATLPAPRAWLGRYAIHKPLTFSFGLDEGLVAAVDAIATTAHLDSRSQLLRGLIRRAMARYPPMPSGWSS